MPTRHRAPKHTYLGLEYENLEIRFHISQIWKNLKDALKPSVQIGCDTFPNELMRFHVEAKPIWKEILKHCKV